MSQTSRSGERTTDRIRKADVAAYSDALRLVRCTQSRSVLSREIRNYGRVAQTKERGIYAASCEKRRELTVYFTVFDQTTLKRRERRAPIAPKFIWATDPYSWQSF
ncbi:MAG: hypothetical protein JWM68_1576 [Verrucomicrobiales bacterium]|nr:hypothetical protein [Verrucomicrobiales bacterium]